MYRDFSLRSKQNLLNLVSQVENEKYCNFTDWVGDRWLDFQSWIGKLNIKNYINNINAYHKKVIDKNNATEKVIEQIFTKVNAIDLTYRSSLALYTNSLRQWQKYIEQMSEIVNPQNGKFHSEYMKEHLEDILSSCYKAVSDAQTYDFNLLSLVTYAKDHAAGIANGLNSEGEIDNTRYSECMDLLEELSNAIGLGTGLAGSDGGNVISSFLSLLTGIGQAGNPEVNTTVLERTRSILNVFSGGLSLDKAVLNLIGLKEDATTFGLVGSAIGIYSELTKAADRDLTEQLKASGGLITKGGILSKGLFHFTESGKRLEYDMSKWSADTRKQYEAMQRNDLNAVTSMATMATYAVGDIMEKSKDGVYDINDYGDTLLSTGIKGMSSLVSSYTYGAVNIDADRSMAVFDKAITSAQDIINSTGAPTPVKVAMAVPGTVIAAAVGTVGTFIDYGMQIGDKIANFFWGDKT